MRVLDRSKAHDVVIEVPPEGTKLAVLKFTSAESEPPLPLPSSQAATVCVPPSCKVWEDGSIRLAQLLGGQVIRIPSGSGRHRHRVRRIGGRIRVPRHQPTPHFLPSGIPRVAK